MGSFKFSEPPIPSSKIDSFMKNFDSGFAKQNRFSVDISVPTGVQADEYSGVAPFFVMGGQSATYFANKKSLPQLSLACSGMTMPGRNISSTKDYQTNSVYATRMDAEPAYMSFYCTSDMRAKRFFDIWQENCVNIKNRSVNFYSEYVTDVRMNQMDRRGNVTYSVILRDAFPSYINAIEYSMSNYSSIIEVSITFDYKFWESGAILDSFFPADIE